ncbi:MAG: RluA family pseudouridine synthase [Aeriscardovia sp.]|nr:RluA family pseudouridine synthase [Aeriscardovia sp.]
MEKIMPVPDGLINMRLDQAISKMLGISRTKADTFIADGQITILGNPETQKSVKLTSSDILSINITEPKPVVEPEATDMEIIYEDEDIVVVNKPVGVAAHPSDGWTGPTVVGSLMKRGIQLCSYGPPLRRGVVSRLDVGTSGCMLLCKSNLAYVRMRKQFAEHSVDKIYHAVTQGRLKQEKATIDAPIGRAKTMDFRFTVSPIGKPAVTHYDVLEHFGSLATFVTVKLETGRTHQIRVHFSSIGHPLVGDPMYGSNPKINVELGLERQWLHATKLGFKHPRTSIWTTVESPYPPDLMHALTVLRSHEKDYKG